MNKIIIISVMCAFFTTNAQAGDGMGNSILVGELPLSSSVASRAETNDHSFTADCTGMFCTGAWACKDKLKKELKKENCKFKKAFSVDTRRNKKNDYTFEGKKYKAWDCHAEYKYVCFD